ncbi:MAG: acylphosphatase [Limnochordales bacterium]|nr:acylphosphatase [Limnochordales bacterium]
MAAGAAGEPLRLYAVVSGVVQGVGFRMFAQREAVRRGLSGYVRNLDDGAVETVVEGPRAALEEYLARLRVGPLGAEVRDVKVEWGPPSGNFHGFHIRY